MRLSVVIPAYNERATIARLLELASTALPHISKELVVVDDCSSDGTREWLRANIGDGTGPCGDVSLSPSGDLVLGAAGGGTKARFEIKAIYHARNNGKGSAVRSGLAAATGEVVVIQDADLEYDPNDWAVMYELIAVRKIADVVYGSRFYGRPHRSLYFHHYVANRLISFLFNVLYNQTLTDVEVCYKMFTRDVRDSLRLTCNDFGFEIQISAQVSLARKWRIYETGISYYGREYQEGKKIRWTDGVKALWYLVRFRF